MRLAIIGLDCAAPSLLFDKFRDRVPNLAKLMHAGRFGALRTCHPPITVPAWTCMMSGYDAGELGIYGFRNRADYTYAGYSLVNSDSVKVPRLWDTLGAAGLSSIVMGVPPTYPARPLRGEMVSCFLTPPVRKSHWTFPPSLAEEVERVANGYVFDAEGFRSDDKAQLLQRVYDKTGKHFKVARHLVASRSWDFLMMVEMGVDRMHHGFWSYMDPEHRNYVPGNPFENAMGDYYAYLDSEIGNLLNEMPSDALVLVVSDHGARRLDGGVCVNEWLIKNGYLVLREYPSTPLPFEKLSVDWTRTRVWGDGGYYGRIFFNVAGREPNGVVRPTELDGLRNEIVRGLEELVPGTSVRDPKSLFRETRGIPPDLIAYFGDLSWRSIGTVGNKEIFRFDNDTGPDEANHDWTGVFIAPNAIRFPDSEASLFDVRGAVLAAYGIPVQ